MKIVSAVMIAIALLLAGFAAGFPVGKSVGFETGSEWALVQADILAREAGVFMPVYLDNGDFRVVIKQPRNFYKRAWRLAEKRDEGTGGTLKTVKLQGLDEQGAWSRVQGAGIARVADRVIR